MKWYRVIWATGWALLTVPVCLLGLMMGRPVTVLVLAGLAAAVAAAITAPDQSRPRRCLEAGIVVGAATAMLYALGAAATGGWLLLFAVTSPPACRAAATVVRREITRRGTRRRWARRRVRLRVVDAVVTADTLASAVQMLDDGELCRAWRASWQTVTAASTPSARLELAHLRQAYLDELERRHPDEIASWLDSGPSPLSDPSRFFARRSDVERRTEGPDLQAS